MAKAGIEKEYTRSPAQAPVAKPYRKRLATVYDAVAGRVSAHGFLTAEPVISKDRDTVSSSCEPVPPDEVLFRRKNAPTRYEEDDVYFANERLGPHQRLPDSDLLKSLHAYASDFYASATVKGGKGDWRSMDETALLAMGILLEETAAEALGETGDLVFVESEDADQSDYPTAWNGQRWVRSVMTRTRGTGKARSKRTQRRALAETNMDGEVKNVVITDMSDSNRG